MNKALEAFRTISEVADDLEVPKHVLRFWEVKFPQIKPMKRGGGRRYYRPEDVVLLRGIRHLLHAEGYTIKGVQKILREQGIDEVKAHGLAAIAADEAKAAAGEAAKAARSAAAAGGRVRTLPTAKSGAKGRKKQGNSVDVSMSDLIEAAIVELKTCRDVLQALGPLAQGGRGDEAPKRAGKANR